MHSRSQARPRKMSLSMSYWILDVSDVYSTDCCILSTGETKDGYYQSLEKAELVRSGSDVTILCYSRMRYVVMQAVQQLENEGYDPEVDISSLELLKFHTL